MSEAKGKLTLFRNLLTSVLVHIHLELVELQHKLNAEIRKVEYRSRPPKSPGHPPGQP